MYNSYRSSPMLTNCTFSGNGAANGDAVGCDSESSPSTVFMVNCILWDGGDEIWNNDGSAITVAYSNVQGGLPSGSIDGGGNIDEDPLFFDPDGVDDVPGTEDDRLCLATPRSPCVDAGDNEALVPETDTDLLGNPRVFDGLGDGIGVVDMGAFELVPVPLYVPQDFATIQACVEPVALLQWEAFRHHNLCWLGRVVAQQKPHRVRRLGFG